MKLIPSAIVGTGILGYTNSVQSDCELDCEIQIPNDFEINICMLTDSCSSFFHFSVTFRVKITLLDTCLYQSH